MKSFVVALILIASVFTFVILNSFYTVSAIDEMLALSENLPKTAEDFHRNRNTADSVVTHLTNLWDQKFPFIVFMSGYGNIDRCDAAIRAFSVHFQNGNINDYLVALSEFRDGLKRLRILEGLHPESIF